ncbi:innexin inx2-like [Amphibalanus amphitrite]|uniref:innexin inx2-like n=1 Tax=Amphibalanus amphitrite TaxID=1232801 RepID=UPI001C91F44F|nr:innexin inx2-like [Amphibalanus amphitrite]
MAITALLGDAAAVIRKKQPGQVLIDNKVFQLHYRVTTFLFLSFSILSTANSLLGDPMNCACADCAKSGITKEIINTHCWITGTFTLPSKQPDNDRLGISKAFPGLGTPNRGELPAKYHLYYQWVPFALFIQGIMFYMPHWMWELNEDGRVFTLVRELRLPTMDKEALKKKVGDLTRYVTETLGSYDGYYLRFVICDALNIVNVIFNIVFTNRFLNGEFYSYGSRCWEYFNNVNATVSPMSETFPKLTKCTFQKFGVSGTVQKLDAICVLALNIFNEKVYLVLWFWLLTLAIITISVFLFRSAFLLMKRFRPGMFQRRALTPHTTDIEDVVRNISVGDYFFLGLLAKNLDITALRLFLSQLARVSRKRRPPPTHRERRPSRAGEESIAMLARPGALPTLAEPSGSPAPHPRSRPSSPRAHHARPASPARLRV